MGGVVTDPALIEELKALSGGSKPSSGVTDNPPGYNPSPGFNPKGGGMEAWNPTKEWRTQWETEKQTRTKATEGLLEIQMEPIKEAAGDGKTARAAKKVMDAMNALEKVPATKDIHSGPLAPRIQELSKALSDLTGLDVGAVIPQLMAKEAITSSEMLQKLGVALATWAAKDLTNRPTQFDFATYIQNNPGILNSPGARRELVNMLDKQADMKIELSKQARRMHAGNVHNWVDTEDKIYNDPKYRYEPNLKAIYGDKPIPGTATPTATKSIIGGISSSVPGASPNNEGWKEYGPDRKIRVIP